MLKKKNGNNTNYKKFLIIFILIILFLFSQKKFCNNINSYDDSTYFTTWATAIHRTSLPSIKLNNKSLRQIIRVSSSGEKIRIKFSNILGKSKLEIKRVCIADVIDNNIINEKSMKFLTFNGNKNVVIKSGDEIYSDTIEYPLKALSKVAISIYFGSAPKYISGHYLSLTYSYIENGYSIFKKEFSGTTKIAHWYFISAMEISSDNPKKTIVCFGDSITDGASKTGDARNISFYKSYSL